MTSGILLFTTDFNNLIHLGPLRFGYRLVIHRDLVSFGIVNQANQVTFWDHAGKPFRTTGDVEAWLDDHRPAPAPATKPLRPLSRLQRAFGGVK